MYEPNLSFLVCEVGYCSTLVDSNNRYVSKTPVLFRRGGRDSGDLGTLWRNSREMNEALVMIIMISDRLQRK
jgi:hypothetical protein